jgi:hypothetical protein
MRRGQRAFRLPSRSLALARAKLALGEGSASLDDLEVIWRDGERGKGGQFGAQIAFSPDSNYLFLTVSDRQRMTPAQDPNQPLGKILRLTLDGKPAPGNPMAGKVGAATVPVINPPADTEKAKTAPVILTYTFPEGFATVRERPEGTGTGDVQVAGNLDGFVVCPDDFEGKVCGCELNEVARVGIVIVGLDIGDAAIINLQVEINEERSRIVDLGRGECFGCPWTR